MSASGHAGKHIAVIGGGAAGFFAAITVAEAKPNAQVTIYEQSQRTLTKVKVSGGGRCNVTHQCFDPARLVTYYPRGGRELRGAFHRWQPQDTLAWFAARGVDIKAEPDGRMFPTTDDSQTIVDCFRRSAVEAGVQLRLGQELKALQQNPEGGFTLELTDGSSASADKVCITAGSLKTSQLSAALESIGHTIEPLAPSLFAFNIRDERLAELAGLAVEKASVQVLPKSKPQSGPILITHKGLSGPAILRLSAWEARALHAVNYRFDIAINWLGDAKEQPLQERFARLRQTSGKSFVRTKVFDAIPRRLWERLVAVAGIGPDIVWSQLPKAQETALIRELIDGRFAVVGKTTNKEEFVTCGGIRLKEVDFKTMESRLVPGLHFAGECLDIDGITGGFNFQAAWTTGHLAGLAMSIA